MIRSCCLLFAIGLVAAIAASSPAAEPKPQPVEPASTEKFEIRNIEGWIVYIDRQDLADHTEAMRRELRHMESQLYQVRLALPAEAVAVMQQRVPFWVAYDAEPGTAYHPSFRWLLDRGYACPKGLKSMVSISRMKDFRRFALHQPWVVFHELAHGYDYMYLGGGRRYSNSRLKEAFDRAKNSGTYDAVLCRYSKSTKHYAMNNPMEYLAEDSEAYFGADDFYPFVRAELKEHDPKMYTLLQDLWGVDVERQQHDTSALAKSLDSGCGPVRVVEENQPCCPVPTEKYDRREIEGWTVHVCPSLVQKKAQGDAACRLLRHKLHLATRYLPEKAFDRLREIPIWLEEGNPAVPYVAYHASTDTIKSAKLKADKLHAIEIGNAKAFRRWESLQPFEMMHLLARAHFDRTLSEQDHKRIEQARQRAIKSKKYDSVLRFDGRNVRHPALADTATFFAEMTEAYFGVNDHYPFLQFETRQHDPETCELLADLWGGKAK